MREQTKLLAGTRMIDALLDYEGDRIFVQFPYNPALLAEIKSMEDRKWHGYDKKNPRKIWSVANTQRNQFTIQFLQGKNPYARYKTPLVEMEFQARVHKPSGNLVFPFEHQRTMTKFMVTRRQCIVAGEMGVGKTLSVIMAMEWAKTNLGWPDQDFWYVAPKSVLKTIQRELKIWNSTVQPRLMTYEGMVKEHKAWMPGQRAPKFLILDECSRVKNFKAQRSIAALFIANAMRDDWGENAFVIEMSGTPAPRAPDDWWHLCLTGDNWILTSQGPKQIIDLLNKPCEVHLDGKNYKSQTGFFKTGEKEVFELLTTDGYFLTATADHRILTLEGWKQLSELKMDDYVRINVVKNLSWDGKGSLGEGYILGLLFGDRNVYTKDNQTYGRLLFCADDRLLIPQVKAYLGCDKANLRSDGYYDLQCGELNALIRRFKVTPDKTITKELETTSKEFLVGFLRGLFDTDGTVEKSRLRLMFAQTNYERIKTVQRILNYFGIFSSIRFYEAKGSICNGRSIKSLDSYRLYITNEDAVRFYDEIGFGHPRKQQILKERIQGAYPSFNKNYSQVRSIKTVGVKEVYDITVEDAHAFAANGIIAHNCEVARPGYLKEGDIFKFRDRLGIIVQKDSPAGGVYPELVTWRDDPTKCHICGFRADHANHDKNAALFGDDQAKYHEWQPSVNEIQNLYKRMSGLVLVIFKKDCLSLPEKRYEQVFLQPKPSTLRTARTITATSSRAIEALTRLRELSDGFQYIEKKVGKQTCDACHGTKRIKEHVPVDPDASITDEFGNFIELETQEVEVECPNCDANGQVDKYDRDSNRVPTPKDDQLKLDLDAHIDIGRLVIFAGFTESVDRVVDVCHSQGWSTIRIDGRGFQITDAKGVPIYADPLELFQDLRDQYPLVAWVGEPSSGGIGHTLTASPTIIYYSNSFVGEARSQSEDRGHRPGMDLNRGLTIRDYIHLPTDMKVLTNLKSKRRLELMSMGELTESLKMEYQDDS